MWVRCCCFFFGFGCKKNELVRTAQIFKTLKLLEISNCTTMTGRVIKCVKITTSFTDDFGAHILKSWKNEALDTISSFCFVVRVQRNFLTDFHISFFSFFILFFSISWKKNYCRCVMVSFYHSHNWSTAAFVEMNYVDGLAMVANNEKKINVLNCNVGKNITKSKCTSMVNSDALGPLHSIIVCMQNM